MANIPTICVSYSDSICRIDAHKFAQSHHLSCVSLANINTKLSLNFTPDYIELRDFETKTSIHVDFISGSTAHRQQYGGGKGQAIAKAIGVKPGKTLPTVLDATAGLAKDAYVIATLGCPVTMVEQSPIVAQLVTDAINRASHDENFIKIQDSGFKLIQQNCLEYLQSITNLPDVIYLDPMYPDRKKSALVKKNMQILQKLLGNDAAPNALLETALQYAVNRVVVKRPKGAQAISALKPNATIETKKTRYDIYFTFKNN
ncbi:16S rRNA (guanine(1516)-N(2))-methyltransferase [hydrothermal vent metagenome]|uniref:16S rRNA (Guanine(1516)-N(2))-methyltransferase n=1 Tax=hydrothermal vent metagenome TaxID=652676 RepID=A0A3B1AQ34_9ZZZZ